MPVFSAIAAAVGGGILGGIAAGAAAGAVIGGVTSALSGGDIGKGILKGALIGGVTGGIGSYASEATLSGGASFPGVSSTFGAPAAGGAVSETSAALAPGLFGQQFSSVPASSFTGGGAIAGGVGTGTASSFMSNPMVQLGMVNSAAGFAKGLGDSDAASELAKARKEENARYAAVDKTQPIQITNSGQQANSYRQYFTPESVGTVKGLA